jgi:hypothetical protein
MTPTTKKTTRKSYSRLASENQIDENQELGFGATLVAEFADASYQPIAIASTLSEAREMAANNLRIRNKENAPTPARYIVWAPNRYTGEYAKIAVWAR